MAAHWDPLCLLDNESTELKDVVFKQDINGIQNSMSSVVVVMVKGMRNRAVGQVATKCTQTVMGVNVEYMVVMASIVKRWMEGGRLSSVLH
jgi:predicted metallopeptidase